MTRASDLARLMGAGGTLNAALSVDTISEKTSGSGVTIDSLNIKDSGIGGQHIGGRRNMIINGAMQVAQRGTSTTGLGADGSSYNTCDRWDTNFLNTAGRLTMSQVSDVHDGFSKALKLDCTTADTSIAAGELFQLMYGFEGQDLQRLKKGSSDAESVTISFYVKGNANATYALELYDSRRGRHASQLFNVTSSWNRISLTFTGDTSDAFDDDNALSMSMSIWLHAGSNYSSGTINGSWAAADNTRRAAGITSFFDSTDRTFFLTGVQMELGSVATPFEHRSFDEERSLCQRYFQVLFETADANHYTALASGRWSTNTAFYSIPLHKIMRAEPSMTVLDKDGTASSGAAGNLQGNGSNDDYTAGNMTLQSGHDGVTTISIGLDHNPSGTHAHVCYFGNGEKIHFDAEL